MLGALSPHIREVGVGLGENGADRGICARHVHITNVVHRSLCLVSKMGFRLDSHQRKTAYETAALLIEPRNREMVETEDWMPSTYRVRTGRSCPTELHLQESFRAAHRFLSLLEIGSGA